MGRAGCSRRDGPNAFVRADLASFIEMFNPVTILSDMIDTLSF